MGAKYPIYAPNGLDVVGEVSLNIDIPHTEWAMHMQVRINDDDKTIDTVGFILGFNPALSVEVQVVEVDDKTGGG